MCIAYPVAALTYPITVRHHILVENESQVDV